MKNDETNQIKAGKTTVGTQKYKCKICGKYYAPEGKKRGYGEEIKKQAIKLYMERSSSRAVGRILGIGKNMYLYWIRKYAKNIKSKVVPNHGLTSLKWTSCTSFVKRKNRFYAITLVSGDTREIGKCPKSEPFHWINCPAGP